MNEDISRKFTCVDILYTNGPLESDVVIEFYTQDGSAEGECILIQLPLCTNNHVV